MKQYLSMLILMALIVSLVAWASSPARKCEAEADSDVAVTVCTDCGYRLAPPQSLLQP